MPSRATVEKFSLPLILPRKRAQYAKIIKKNLLTLEVVILLHIQFLLTIKALQRRAYTICSEEDSKEEEVNTVKTYFSYLQKLIIKCNQEIMKPKFDNNYNERKILVTAP